MRLRGVLGSITITVTCFIALIAGSGYANVQVERQISDQDWRATISKDGVQSFESFKQREWRQYPFRTGENGGPRPWVLVNGKREFIPLQPTADTLRFEGRMKDLATSLRYFAEGPLFGVEVMLKNKGETALTDLRFGLQLGVDTYMEKYPEWSDKLFPTLLRCEKTHFIGYFMSPSGHILVVTSPDPIASFERMYIGKGHRIGTVSLNLLHPGPLPPRHPVSPAFINPNEERHWIIYFEGAESLTDVKPAMARSTQAPIVDADRYTVNQPQPLSVRVFSRREPELKVTNPDGNVLPLRVRKIHSGIYETTLTLNQGFGLYTLSAQAGDRISEAPFTLARPFSWYLLRAREAAEKYQQKASSHIESAYGFFSAFLARKHFPEPALDKRLDERFQKVIALLYDDKMQPNTYPERIQNSAGFCSLLVDRYEATGDRSSLEKAVQLADFLLTRQKADGGFYRDRTHFTSVIYIAKSIMELMLAEKRLADAGDATWNERYNRHYEAVRRAMDDLVRRGGNIQTEGQMTFEDGMMSCSALQLAMFALLQNDAQQRRKYTDAALSYLKQHDSLTQLLVPDSRMNGATLRFWESQYDVMVYPNMMDSPHGWSAWRIYATYNIYLLTGDPQYLRMTMNALGSCLQLVETQTGKLRWGFIADPYIEAKVFFPDTKRPGFGKFEQRIIGEQYVDMVSDWWRAPEGKVVGGYVGHVDDWGAGGAGDNDVHEIFKAMEEVVLDAAFVVMGRDGKLETWNCTVKRNGKLLEVYPAEAIVNRIHVNAASSTKVRVHFSGRTAERTVKGLTWISG